MLLNDSSLHCSSYCFTKLCSDWNSQGQSYLLVTAVKKWNMWWKSSKGWGQLEQTTNPTGHLFPPASPALLRQLCHSGSPAVTALLWLRRCHCPAFPALSICPPVLPLPHGRQRVWIKNWWAGRLFSLQEAGAGWIGGSLFIPFGGTAGLWEKGQHQQAVPTTMQRKEGIALACSKKRWCWSGVS